MKKILLCFLIGFATASCYLGEKRKNLSRNHHQIAVSLMKECDHPRALSHLLKGVKMDSQNFLIRYTLAVVYFVLKDYELTIKELKKVLKQNPKVTEARVTLSQSYLELGEVDKALKEIKKAEQDQTYSNPLKIIALKGRIYFKKREMFKARKEFKELLSIPKSKNCFATLYLGRTEMALKNFKESENLLKKARRICSNEKPVCEKKNYNAHFFLATLYLKKNQKKKARYHLKIFLKVADASNPYISKARNLLNKNQ